jgi:hypothetical protein
VGAILILDFHSQKFERFLETCHAIRFGQALSDSALIRGTTQDVSFLLILLEDLGAIRKDFHMLRLGRPSFGAGASTQGIVEVEN